MIFNFDIRTDLWREAYINADFSHYLIGGGIGSFEKIELMNNNIAKHIHPHNILILFQFEFGIPGTVCFLFSLFYYNVFISNFINNNSRQISSSKNFGPQLLFLVYIICITLNSNIIAHEYLRNIRNDITNKISYGYKED